MERKKIYWMQNSVICPTGKGAFTVSDHGGARGTAGTLMQAARRR